VLVRRARCQVPPRAGAAPQVAQGAVPGDSDNVELALTEEALTGFLSWLEASPPGSHLSGMAL